jgi:Protein of unknown function (Hypoth_ymh)
VTTESEPEGIEYHGVAGSSQDCQNAVMRLLQFGDIIARARILSCASEHAFLLTSDLGDVKAIKSGFSSGYGGAGPTAFSYVLQLLEAHGVEIEEYIVDKAILERLDQSALTSADMRVIDAAKPLRPSRWHYYMLQQHIDCQRQGTFWRDFPPVIPYGIIDSRIADLALGFWQNPDDRILTAYKRLEDIIRRRTGLKEHGTKLFSKAFSGETAQLYWKDIDDGERTGRANLFTGAYMAHRNPLAHRETKNQPDQQLTEFLLLNHLYLLEKNAEVSPVKSESA